jgi:ParB family chromosome partitioning protein
MGAKPWEKLLCRSDDRQVVNIPLNKLMRNPFQPRREFDEPELNELAHSIKEFGVLQPVIVRKHGSKYQIIAGERRCRACLLLGLKQVPAIIHEFDDESAAAVSLIENLQRKELNYFEEAQAYSILINVFGCTQEELAKKIGKSQSAIANKLRLLKIPEPTRSLISPEQVTERHARILLKIGSSEIQLKVLEKIYEKELTVKETEELVENLGRGLSHEPKNKPSSQNVAMIIKDARIFLNTIKETVKRGKQTGMDIVMVENDQDSHYELLIRIPKQQPQKVRYMAKA